MINSHLFFLLVLLTLFLIGSLKMLNLQPEKRHKQVWLPIGAFIYMVIVINVNNRYLNGLLETIFELFPSIRDYSLIVINLFLLLGFVLSKSLWRGFLTLKDIWVILRKKFSFISDILDKILILLPENTRKELTRQDQTLYVFYQKTKEGIFLNPESVFARKLFLYSSYLAMVTIISFIFLAFNPSLSELIRLFPSYPVLSFLILAELTWFLGGRLPQSMSKHITGMDVISHKMTQYDNLFEEYKRLWPEQILSTSKAVEIRKIRDFQYQKLSKDPDTQIKVNRICEKIKIAGHPIIPNYAQILTCILEEKDCLVVDPNYDEMGQYFFPAIHSQLSKDKKLIVITDSTVSARKAVQWFYEGIQHVTGMNFIYSIAAYPEAAEQNLQADILVVSPKFLSDTTFYQFIEKYSYTGGLEGVIILDAEKVIMEYGLFIQLFHLKLLTIFKNKPQYIIFSKFYQDLEPFMRSLLQIELYDIHGAFAKTEKLFYINWKIEGEGAFQSKILPRLIHRRLDPDVILALPAIKYGVESLHYMNQHHNTSLESVAELMDHQVNLIRYGIQENQFVILERHIKFYHQNWGIETANPNFIVARDVDYNLIDTLIQWRAIGKKASFVHVLSQPYLLRDYLARNVESFIDNHRKFSPLSTRISKSSWRNAFLLIERLSTEYIDTEEILKAINAPIGSDEPMIEALGEFYQSQFHLLINFRHLLHIKNEDVFDRDKHKFINKTKYHLPHKVKNDLFPNLFRFLDIRSNTGEILGQIVEGNVFQNYLIGQYHVFNGTQFLIKSIDKNMGVLEVSFEEPVGDMVYRQSRKYTIFLNGNLSNKVEETIPVRINHLEVRNALIEPEITVDTLGYFTFSKGIDLFHSSTRYTKLNQDEKRLANRTYPKRNVLLIQLSSKTEVIPQHNKVALTIAHLLNELFPSIFPKTFQYLAACTPLPNDMYLESTITEKVGSYIPQIMNSEIVNSQSAIYLYIFEDSPLHLGLLESVQEKWEHILELIADYLDWAIEEMKQNYKPFFFLGHSTLPEVFELDYTRYFLNCLTPNNKLKEIREIKNVTATPITTEEDITVCDFCGEALPVAEKEHLEDLRDRCLSCRETAIDTVVELEPLYDEVRDYFLFNLKLTIRQDIYVKLLSAQHIQNQEFIPTSRFDPRIIGKAIKSNDNQYSILIENGAPRAQTLGTLAHELTHIWQFEHLDLNTFSIEQLEGHSVWAEIHYLEAIGEHVYATKLKNQMMSREDEYGRGYRDLLRLLEQYPRGITPFELYHSYKNQSET
jgi:hypothetical protein